MSVRLTSLPCPDHCPLGGQQLMSVAPNMDYGIITKDIAYLFMNNRLVHVACLPTSKQEKSLVRSGYRSISYYNKDFFILGESNGNIVFDICNISMMSTMNGWNWLMNKWSEFRFIDGGWLIDKYPCISSDLQIKYITSTKSEELFIALGNLLLYVNPKVSLSMEWQYEIHKIAFSKNILFLSSIQGNIEIFDFQNNQRPISTIYGKTAVTLVTNTDFGFVYEQGCKIYMIDLTFDTSATPIHLELHESDKLHSINCLADSSLVFTYANGNIYTWNMKNGFKLKHQETGNIVLGSIISYNALGIYILVQRTVNGTLKRIEIMSICMMEELKMSETLASSDCLNDFYSFVREWGSRNVSSLSWNCEDFLTKLGIRDINTLDHGILIGLSVLYSQIYRDRSLVSANEEIFAEMEMFNNLFAHIPEPVKFNEICVVCGCQEMVWKHREFLCLANKHMAPMCYITGDILVHDKHVWKCTVCLSFTKIPSDLCGICRNGRLKKL
jgi:hypothetical protein